MQQREIQMLTPYYSSFFAQWWPEIPEPLLGEHCQSLLQENLWENKSDFQKAGKLRKHYMPLFLLSV